MQIRDIAREFYRLQKELDRLGRMLAAAGKQERAIIEQRLRKVMAEKQRMKRIYDGRIDR